MHFHRPFKTTGGIAAHGGTAQSRNAKEKGDAAEVNVYFAASIQWFSLTLCLLILLIIKRQGEFT